jgi:pyruvate/2-oxoacid:ferredoxin oxidoreductase beta subunit
MNTGAQKSSSTPRFARTGSTPAGKTTRKKNLTEIMAAHGVPYVATASAGHLADLRRKLEKAKALRGTRILTLLIPCLDGWGLAEDAGLAAARLAVETGAFPLYEVEHGTHYTLQSEKTRPIGEYLAIQSRYRHLQPEQITALQADIDAGWARLQRQATLAATAAPH